MAVLYYKQLIAIFIFGVVDHPISSRIDLIDPFALFRPQARPNIFRRHGIDRRNGQYSAADMAKYMPQPWH